jgi:hypothetical protein
VKWANVARQVMRVALIMAASIQRNNERAAARGNGRWAVGDGRWALGDYWTDWSNRNKNERDALL